MRTLFVFAIKATKVWIVREVDVRLNLLTTIETKKSSEIRNGIFFRKTFRLHANRIVNYYAYLSPTNDQVKISLKTDGGFLEELSVSDQELLHKDNLRMFLRFGKPPELRLNMTALYFPNVSIDVVDAIYDFNAVMIQGSKYVEFMQSGANSEITIPLDRKFQKLYISVVGLGIFSVENSESWEFGDTKFRVTIQIEGRVFPDWKVISDEISAFLNVILMIFFVGIILFFCISWKACPFCFHCCMRRVIPELYFMKQKRKMVFFETKAN